MTEQELATALATTRPRPSDEWLADFEARAEAGFPRPRRSLVGPGVAGALVALVALVAALGVATRGGGGGDAGDAGAGAGGGSSAVTQRAAREHDAIGSARSAPQVAASPPLPSAAADAAPSPARRVERSAELTLGAPSREVDDVADGVVRVTDAVGGYVARSRVDSGRGAELLLRVPSARLSDALGRLSRLAHVRARSQATTDITAPTGQAARRVSDLRTERRALLGRLAAATTENEAASVRARLRDNAARLSAAERSLARLHRRADLSTVDVSVAAQRQRPASGGAWTLGDAWHDAGRVLAVALGASVVALAAGLPLGLIAGLGWMAARALRRRRREHVLDVA